MTTLKYRSLEAIALVLLAIPQFVVAFGFREPMFVGVGVVGLVLASLALAADRWWAVVPGVVGAAVAMLHTGLFYTAYQHFDSGLEFGYVTSCAVLGVSVVVVGAVDLRSRASRRAAAVTPAVLRSYGAVVAVLLAVVNASAIATVSGRETVSAADRQGALVVEYKDLKVHEGETLVASAAGSVRIVVDNKDLGYHDFVIDGATDKVGLGPRESKLIEARLAAGTYIFRCTISGHEAMKGTLTVR